MTAAEIFESLMLICFGLSWPMSVLKNIKARTAKNMSLPFILLICSGYIAGITAKIITHNMSYVLIVYVLNLLIVSANIVIYFINKRRDKKAKLKNCQNQNKTIIIESELSSIGRKVVSE